MLRLLALKGWILPVEVMLDKSWMLVGHEGLTSDRTNDDPIPKVRSRKCGRLLQDSWEGEASLMCSTERIHMGDSFES